MGTMTTTSLDYVRDPYKQSGVVAVSLHLDNFGDDANDSKTWFRIDYHKTIRMRNNGGAGEARDDFAKSESVFST